MKELSDRGIEYIYIHSGQHQDTISELLNNFNLKQPDHVLHTGKDITKPFQIVYWSIKILLIALLKKKSIIGNDLKPVIINHGDTLSALIGSVFAKITGSINVHIESGLRSFNFLHPFPEEITRILVFYLTDIYFAPDKNSFDNLEKYSGIKINTCQNTMYDSTLLALQSNYSHLIKINTKYTIISVHRYENIFNKKQLSKITEIVEKIADRIKVIFILHKPTKQQLKKFNLYHKLASNIKIDLYDRQDYFTFVKLLSDCEFLVTDGGSNQEESSYLGIPCLLLRKTTERNEGLGENVLLSKYSQSIIDNFINNYKQYRTSPQRLDKSPSTIIVNEVLKALNNT